MRIAGQANLRWRQACSRAPILVALVGDADQYATPSATVSRFGLSHSGQYCRRASDGAFKNPVEVSLRLLLDATGLSALGPSRTSPRVRFCTAIGG